MHILAAHHKMAVRPHIKSQALITNCTEEVQDLRVKLWTLCVYPHQTNWACEACMIPRLVFTPESLICGLVFDKCKDLGAKSWHIYRKVYSDLTENLLSRFDTNQAEYISHDTHPDPHTVLEWMHHLVQFHHTTTGWFKLEVLWGNICLEMCPWLLSWASWYEMITHELRKRFPPGGIFPLLLSSLWNGTSEGVNGPSANTCWLKASTAFWRDISFSLFISVVSV